MKYAAIYTRYSTEQQQSTLMQIEKCQEYAAKNSIPVYSVYSDEAETGTNTARKDFQRLILDAQSGKFDTVIIYDISRGSRDVSDWFNFRKLMSNLNIKVLSTTERLGDILNPSDFLTELITVGIGQHQVLQSRQKSIDGKTTQAKEGLFQGGIAPLGYDIVNKHYYINEYEAKAVRLVFNMYINGNSYGKIIKELNSLGYRGKRGQKLGKNSIYFILNNDRYTGHYSWNRDLNRKMHIWVGLKGANPNRVELDNKIPPIIDDGTWRKAQMRLKSRAQAKFRAIEPYLLSGKITCDNCGGKYVGHTSTNSRGVRTRSYVCGNKYRTHDCSAPNINAERLEIELRMELTTWLKSIDCSKYAKQVVVGINNSTKIDKKSLFEELHELEKNIKNATLVIIKNPTFESVRDELAKMQVRKNEIDELLSQDENRNISADKIKRRIVK